MPVTSLLFLGAIGIEQAHVAACRSVPRWASTWPPAIPAACVAFLAHCWHASDDYLKIVVEQWRALASTLRTIADVVIQGIFPWCFTPEMHVERPEFADTLVDFVRSHPA